MSTCSAVATHPYLIIAPPLANADLDEAKEAEYLMSSSGKFAALGKILDALRSDKETKVGIMVQDVKGMDMLEGFLRGRNIRVRRTDGESVREQQNVQSRGGPDITIVLGGKAGARAIVVFLFPNISNSRIELMSSLRWIYHSILRTIRPFDYDNILQISMNCLR